jgi:hypothetical protein
MRLAGHIAGMGKTNSYRILVGKPEGKRPLGGWTMLKWILREKGWGCMDWTDLAQDRDQWRALVNMARNIRVP